MVDLRTIPRVEASRARLGNPAAIPHLAEIIADPAIEADQPTLYRVALLAYCSNNGTPAIQHKMPRIPPRPRHPYPGAAAL